MSKTVKRVWNIVTWLIVALAILLAILLVGVRLLGFEPLVVTSGSMGKACPVGSLIYVKEVDYHDLKVGDVITFALRDVKDGEPIRVDDDTLATHRIIEVLTDPEEPDTLRFVTQGDANDNPDGAPVHYKNIVGRVSFTIPKLGYVSNYIQNPPGMYVAISGGAVLLLLIFLPDLFSSDDKSKKKKEEEAAEEAEPAEEPKPEEP